MESLTALAVLGIGLLPLATLAPVALGALRQYEVLGHATRAAAELAELEDPGLALSTEQASGIGPHQLQLCQSVASMGAEHGLSGCVAGSRLAVVGPLRPASVHPGGLGSQSALRVIALWVRP
ncbi:hypothetical protein [Cupriavidus sp. 8B]